MDLKREIIKEHSKAMAHKIADYVGHDTRRFKVLFDVYLAGPYRVTQRAAYPMGVCVERYPDLILPHLSHALRFLHTPGIHQAVKRNTLRMLQFIEIPKRFHGQITSICFDYLQSRDEPVAVKAFSITVLAKIIHQEPDLLNELKIIIEDQLPYSSPAFVFRARKLLNEKRD